MTNIVEINGHQYDATTGKLLGRGLVANQSSKPAQPQGNGIFIDGVSRRKPKKNASTHSALPLVKSAFRIPNEHNNNSKIKKPKTLARSTVVKPGNESSDNNLKSKLVNRVSPGKVDRANRIAKSQKISHFPSTSPLTKISASLPIIKQSEGKSILPAPPLLTKMFSKPRQSSKQVFEHQIQNSTTHLNKGLPKEKFHARIARHIHVSPKIVSVGAACLVILLVGGYLAYLKIPAVAMKVAAGQAGFSGSLPSNVPAGYSFSGPLKATKGTIVLNYSSNSDDRKFSIVQKPTDWSSEALLSNFLIKSKLQYQTYHDKGLTVFIYKDSNATWVDKGIWFSLTGHSSLSSDQILAIAGSM